MILGTRRLAQQRHAQTIERAQKASQGEFARQAREDKAIHLIPGVEPAANFRRM